jgi:DNA-binding CsgD family transcriptional regulator
MRATSPMPGQSSDLMRMAPSCPHHPGSLVRRFRTQGPQGPGVYPQCVPSGRDTRPHLLSWTDVRVDDVELACIASLSPRERDVLDDAASGLSVIETAAKRIKSTETVKTQRKSIMLKLDARNMTEAVALTRREPVGTSDARGPTSRELLA